VKGKGERNKKANPSTLAALENLEGKGKKGGKRSCLTSGKKEKRKKRVPPILIIRRQEKKGEEKDRRSHLLPTQFPREERKEG